MLEGIKAAGAGVDLAPLKAALAKVNSNQVTAATYHPNPNPNPNLNPNQLDTSMLSAPVAVMQATLLRVGVRARVRVRVRDAGHAQGV